MDQPYGNREPGAGEKKRPVPVFLIIFIADFSISILAPLLMSIFSFIGYLIEIVAIMAVYTIGAMVYFNLYVRKKNPEKRFLRFYVRGIMAAIPGMLVSTIYLLFYYGIISGIREGAIVLFIITNIMFALSILFPFIRQERIIRGKDRTLRSITGDGIEPLHMKLKEVNCRYPMLYVRNLGGRKIANASQVGITKPVIIMTDFLYENMNGSDLSAILGHEMGHFVDSDAFRSILMFTIPAFLTLDFTLYAIITLTIIPIILAAAFIVYQFLNILFIFPGSRRKSEISADRFVGLKIGMAEDMVSALETLIIMNGRPFEYRFISSRTHPSIEERISILRKYFHRDI